MYLGQIVETGPVVQVLDRPAHPYTAALPRPSRCPIPRWPASAAGWCSAARWRPTEDRGWAAVSPPCCPHAMEVCRREDPDPYPAAGDTTVRCHLHTDGPRLAGRSVLSLAPSEAGAP